MAQGLGGIAFTPAVLTRSSAFHLIYIPSVDFLRGRRPTLGKGEMGVRERRDMGAWWEEREKMREPGKLKREEDLDLEE